jgi:hypothetical protein
MPESMEPGEQDRMSDGVPVAKQEAAPAALEAHAAEAPPRDAGQPDPTQASGESPSDHSDGEEIADFAHSVVSGLEQAGLGLEETVEFSEEAALEVLELPETGDAFFDGWARGSEGVAQDGSERPIPTNAETLLDLSLMQEALLRDLEGEAPEIAPSSKHDELADAVQLALASVYGDHFSSSPQQTAFSASLRPAARWDDGGQAAGNGDGRSPQDVILNYFDYMPSGEEQSRHGAPGYGEAAGSPRRSPPGQHDVNGAPASIHPFPQRQPDDVVQMPGFDADFGAAATLPAISDQAQRNRTAVSAERESGRLLGAAAIGLIGGIAIAATLAVFVISSYGPDKNPLGAPNRKTGVEPGYGIAPEALETSKPAPAQAEAMGETLASDVTVTPGQPAPLAVSIRSPHPFEQTLVSITGVPRGGRLSAGVDAGNGNWLLPPRRLNGLTLTLPAGTAEAIPLEVQLLDSNARTSLSEKSKFIVRVNASAEANSPAASNAWQASPLPKPEQSPQQLPSFNTMAVGALPAPASAPAPGLAQAPADTPSAPASIQQAESTTPQQPEPAASLKSQPGAQPEQASAAPFQTSVALSPPARSAALTFPTPSTAGRPLPSPEVEDLIREGNKRMREGDILEARQYYQKAVSLGDPEAALAMGRSYDPIYFARIERKNAEPDAAKAFDWYRKAMDNGAVQTAKVRIENLKHFLNE